MYIRLDLRSYDCQDEISKIILQSENAADTTMVVKRIALYMIYALLGGCSTTTVLTSTALLNSNTGKQQLSALHKRPVLPLKKLLAS